MKRFKIILLAILVAVLALAVLMQFILPENRNPFGRGGLVSVLEDGTVVEEVVPDEEPVVEEPVVEDPAVEAVVEEPVVEEVIPVEEPVADPEPVVGPEPVVEPEPVATPAPEPVPEPSAPVGSSFPDLDGDTVADSTDNCLYIPNEDQRDMDKDGKGNACDNDSDNDGVANAQDKCIWTFNARNVDATGCVVKPRYLLKP